MQPSDVTLENASIARKNLQRRYLKNNKKKKAKYRVGDVVRITRTRGTFEKVYESGWSEELFIIKRIITWRTYSPVVYELEYLAGKVIDGLFYEQELADVKNRNVHKGEFIVEKIIQTRGKASEKQALVKWAGHPDKFNSWIPASELKNI
ncbi:uncharacterized protein LOC117181325 [Belonocnema kinseyi]|uniref:uncharacterized protein LOC117181325 n=1 Tax=Belonocnema kinseyi TaxID=2817044 RepID=UPI00143CC46E|nr:uncharacterized protein LOC117181325 [Belonocnema kinseyi]